MDNYPKIFPATPSYLEHCPNQTAQEEAIRPQGYKTVYMLNSGEHEIFPVGILTFMSGKNSILGLSEPDKC